MASQSENLERIAATGTDSEYKDAYAKFIGKRNASALTTDEVNAANSQKQGYINSYRNRNSSSNRSSNRSSNSPTTPVVTAGIASLMSAFKSTQNPNIRDNEMSDPEQLFKKLRDSGGNFSALMKTAGSEILTQIQQENQLRTDINEKIGISGDLSRAFRDEIVDTIPQAIRLGYGISDISEMMTSMMEASGRFNLISSETIERSFSTARAFVGSLGEMGKLFNDFEKVGIGASGAMDAIDKAGRGSLSLGLRAKTTINDIREQIEKLNKYGFKDGIEGLATMSRKAKEFRMELSEVFDIAKTVMSPEGAITLAANMQALGGAIGAFNDPLKLMYMATNNVEGLQDALIGAAKNLASFNEQTGRFEITGVNMRRAREMAEQLGVSYESLTRTAIAAQERMAANSDLMGRGFKIEEKDKEFITNLAKMDNGKMTIEIPKSLSEQFAGQTKVTLDTLTEKQYQVLKENRDKLEAMNPQDIARDQLSEIQNIGRDVAAMWQLQKIQVTKELGQEFLGKKLVGVEEEMRKYTDKFIKENRGVLSGENKEKARELIASFKETEQYKSLKSEIDALSTVVGNSELAQKIRSRLENLTSTDNITNSAQNNTQTVNHNHNHTFGFSNVHTDEVQKALIKNPQVMNEWVKSNDPKRYENMQRAVKR